MAAEGGRADAPLARTLFDEPYRFEFFQAVRLLERMQPDKQPVGRIGTSPQKEVVRFRSRASLDFPPSELYEITRRNSTSDEDDESPPEMVVAFMGLTGPLGVLPSHYTEMVADRALQRHRTVGVS